MQGAVTMERLLSAIRNHEASRGHLPVIPRLYDEQRLSFFLFSRVSSHAEAIFICRGSMRFIIRLGSPRTLEFLFPSAVFSCGFPRKDRGLLCQSIGNDWQVEMDD